MRAAIKLTARTLTVRLHEAAKATIRLDRGVLRGHPHGRAEVQLVRVNGKRFTLRPKAARLR